MRRLTQKKPTQGVENQFRLPPINSGLGGPNGARKTSEDVEQGSDGCRPTRNRVIFLLSVKAGLRAKEIACLTWRMVTDARGQIGQAIHLEDTASKGRSGRIVPMNEELRTALREYAETIWMPTSTFLIQSERSRGMSPQAIVNLFWRLYRHVSFYGCSSHSRRRRFLATTAR